MIVSSERSSLISSNLAMGATPSGMMEGMMEAVLEAGVLPFGMEADLAFFKNGESGGTISGVDFLSGITKENMPDQDKVELNKNNSAGIYLFDDLHIGGRRLKQ